MQTLLYNDAGGLEPSLLSFTLGGTGSGACLGLLARLAESCPNPGAPANCARHRAAATRARRRVIPPSLLGRAQGIDPSIFRGQNGDGPADPSLN
jgi:hypothetical protein